MTSEETRIKKGHITMMKHTDTALYAGVFMMGNNEVVDAKFTAYTDGVNKKYSRSFLAEIKSEPKVRGLILHENLHVALKHVILGKTMFKENPKLANMAADFVVNDIIANINGTLSTGEKLVELPDGALYHPMFHNWSMREVYDYLKQNCKKKPEDGKGGKGQGSNPSPHGNGSKPSEEGSEEGSGGSLEVDIDGKTFKSDTVDEHDFEGGAGEDSDEVAKRVDRALREGGILAGRLGGKMPRAITDLLNPKIDWRDVLRDFVTSSVRGKDELTWRKPNKRQMANDIYLPSVENETIGEVIVAIDTSGSIGGKELSEFASELASICETVNPEKVRVLWWDTEVHGEQVFQDNYAGLAHMLKPKGGGGTRVGCVSDWLSANPRINAECLIVFTDGHLENRINWKVSKPTLWLVTQNGSFDPPSGKKIKMEKH